MEPAFVWARAEAFQEIAMISLTYLKRYEIEDREAGLIEPSGLALAPDGSGLWTVSDDTKRVFRLNLDGQVEPNASFKLSEKGLEGITVDRKGKFLLAVREESNEIFRMKIGTRNRIKSYPLKDMAGYRTVKHLFGRGGENKGLEGITWNGDTGSFFVLKEGKPGLLVELTEDLQTILSHVLLDARNGFVDPDQPDRKVDFSGLCHDPLRSLLWIVSDKAGRLYFYDLGRNRVLHSVALNYTEDGNRRRIEKAEGMAYDPETGRVYVVSDKNARLYVYEVGP